jgi:hypothetical protein
MAVDYRKSANQIIKINRVLNGSIPDIYNNNNNNKKKKKNDRKNILMQHLQTP